MSIDAQSVGGSFQCVHNHSADKTVLTIITTACHCTAAESISKYATKPRADNGNSSSSSSLFCIISVCMFSVECRVEHIVSDQAAHKPVEIGESATVHMLQPDEPFTPPKQTTQSTSIDQVHQPQR